MATTYADDPTTGYATHAGRRSMTKGYKTSEFWALVAGALVAIGNQGLGLDLDTATVTGFAGMVASYILGRSGLKAAKR